MSEPITAREIFLIIYIAFTIFGGLYVLSSVPMLLASYRKREKRKRKADRDTSVKRTQAREMLKKVGIEGLQHLAGICLKR